MIYIYIYDFDDCDEKGGSGKREINIRTLMDPSTLRYICFSLRICLFVGLFVALFIYLFVAVVCLLVCYSCLFT